jgi:hypothetical protein
MASTNQQQVRAPRKAKNQHYFKGLCQERGMIGGLADVDRTCKIDFESLDPSCLRQRWRLEKDKPRKPGNEVFRDHVISVLRGGFESCACISYSLLLCVPFFL